MRDDDHLVHRVGQRVGGRVRGRARLGGPRAQQRRGAPSLERVSRSLRAMIVRMMTYDAASRPSIDALAATDHWHRAHAHLADGQTHIHWLRAQQPGTSYATTAAPRPIYY